MNLWKPFELLVTGAARSAWPAFQVVNHRFKSQTFSSPLGARPAAEEPRAIKPQLGWPRTTDSLVPDVRARDARTHPLRRAVARIARRRAHGRDPGAHPRARRQGRHREDLPDARHVHRHARDQPGVPRRRIESLFPGRDFPAVTDKLHNHGTSSIQHGRGAVLTIDLTNRCNMMCDPCFMDANQVGYVHELTLDEVKTAPRRRGQRSSRGGR